MDDESLSSIPRIADWPTGRMEQTLGGCDLFDTHLIHHGIAWPLVQAVADFQHGNNPQNTLTRVERVGRFADLVPDPSQVYVAIAVGAHQILLEVPVHQERQARNFVLAINLAAKRQRAVVDNVRSRRATESLIA